MKIRTAPFVPHPMPRSPIGRPALLALALLLPLAAGTSHLFAQSPAPPLRILVNEDAQDLLRPGTPELIWEPRRKAVRFPLTNESQDSIAFHVQTLHVSPPDDHSSGTLQGLTRGFMGVLFMGASEIPSDDPVISSHQLAPGQTLIVAHTLSPRAGPQEIVATVNLGAPLHPVEDDSSQNAQRRQQREDRDDYHEARKQEEARWKELRNQLLTLQKKSQPLTPEYKIRLHQYWEAFTAHKNRLKTLEEESLKPTPADPSPTGN